MNRKKDELARQVADLRTTFELALSDKRRYPVQEFKAFVQTVRRYMQITAGDPMIHKSVARAVNDVREFLEVERKGIPGEIILEAYRLESQLFNGYDPKFDGMNLRASDHLCSRNSLKRISLYIVTTHG
ncbi:MAG: hypothetical protein JO108_16110 [Acidobacteriaceae bacterium]|nr:hypothetical protein [Acidobacteriaceae bacterium]